ncbi:MAG TPA: P-loop NTPase [Longimicrobiales bacterium]
MRRIRTYREVSDPAGQAVLDQVAAQRRRLVERLSRVRHVVAVASGKGGVGKSAITANVAAVLASRGLRVGAADADLNGPSLARMLGVAGARLRVEEDGVAPAEGAAGVRVVSMDLLLAAEDAPLRWRGAGLPADGAPGSLWQSSLEAGALREFLADTAWGELDYLLIDVPPGTDKLARLLELLPAPPTLAVVTTPSEIARFVVAKSVRLAHETGAAAVGLVANMCAYVCATCGRESPLYAADGARRLAEATGAPLWAEVPFDPRLALATDAGAPFALEGGDAPAARALHALADRIAEEAARGNGRRAAAAAARAPEHAAAPGGPRDAPRPHETPARHPGPNRADHFAPDAPEVP